MTRTLTLTNQIELRSDGDECFVASASCWDLLRSVACSFDKYLPRPGPYASATTANELADALEKVLPDLKECVVTIQGVDPMTDETNRLRDFLCGDDGEGRVNAFIKFLRQGPFVIDDDRPKLKLFLPD